MSDTMFVLKKYFIKLILCITNFLVIFIMLAITVADHEFYNLPVMT